LPNSPGSKRSESGVRYRTRSLGVSSPLSDSQSQVNPERTKGNNYESIDSAQNNSPLLITLTLLCFSFCHQCSDTSPECRPVQHADGPCLFSNATGFANANLVGMRSFPTTDGLQHRCRRWSADLNNGTIIRPRHSGLFIDIPPVPTTQPLEGSLKQLDGAANGHGAFALFTNATGAQHAVVIRRSTTMPPAPKTRPRVALGANRRQPQ